MSRLLTDFLKSLSVHPVIAPSIPYNDYTYLDLSISNKELETVDVSSAEAIQAYIDVLLE